jgi:hypothetical protein
MLVIFLRTLNSFLRVEPPPQIDLESLPPGSARIAPIAIARLIAYLQHFLADAPVFPARSAAAVVTRSRKSVRSPMTALRRLKRLSPAPRAIPRAPELSLFDLPGMAKGRHRQPSPQIKPPHGRVAYFENSEAASLCAVLLNSSMFATPATRFRQDSWCSLSGTRTRPFSWGFHC